MIIKIKKVKSVKDNSSIKQTVKKAEKKTGGSSLDIKIRKYSSKPKKKSSKVMAKGKLRRGDNNDNIMYVNPNIHQGGQGQQGGQGGG
jgi:hypothetical protein